LSLIKVEWSVLFRVVGLKNRKEEEQKLKENIVKRFGYLTILHFVKFLYVHLDMSMMKSM